MSNTRELIYLGALIHDMGKFFQRAEPYGLKTSKMVEKEIKNLETSYCPNFKGIYSHKHVIWTAQFIADLKLDSSFSNDTLQLMPLSCKHHAPSTFEEKIIQRADHMSSGVDRQEKSGQKDAEAEEKLEFFKNVRMRSVFEAAFKEVENPQEDLKYQYRIDLKPLSLEGDFPCPEKDFKTPPDYEALWHEFMKEARRLEKGSFRAFTEGLADLLKVYTHVIPSSTMHLPDVSLYDHLATTAGLALSLYDYCEDTYEGKNMPKTEEPFALLIGADLSGIQSFIYDIVSKNAAKNLKGRSFYLELLMEDLLRELKLELDLFEGNVIYNSGGGFYLIAANTTANKNKIKDIQARVNKRLFDLFETKLYVALNSVELSYNDLIARKGPSQGNNLGQKWKELSEKVNAQKRNRYGDYFLNRYAEFFEPGEATAKNERDEITGLPLYKKVKEGGLDVSEITAEQIKLGRNLNRSQFLFAASENFRSNGYRVQSLKSYYGLEPEEKLSIQGGDEGALYSINRTDFLQHQLEFGKALPVNAQRGFRFYGGNRVPQKISENAQGGTENKTFDELTRDDKSTFQRLGVLRMDVDNLGTLFIKGLKEEKRTFSRLAAISRQLDWFFKGYINTILKQINARNNDSVYVIYSGGDDLFLIGDWMATLAFAKQLQKDFRAFTCGNDKLTLSGGLVFVPQKYPIMRSADLAGEAEKMAKEHALLSKDGGVTPVKNSLTLFGYPLHWEVEFPVVEELKDKMVRYVSGREISRSLIGRILNFNEMRAHSESQAVPDLSYRWLMAYNLSQYSKSLKKDSEAKAWLHELKNNLFANSYRGPYRQSKYSHLELAAIAARWAELELRSIT